MRRRNRGRWSRLARTAPVVLGLVLVSASAAFGATAGGSKSGPKASVSSSGNVTIRIAMPLDSPPINLPVWIAAKEGFFAKRGLNVVATTPNIPFSSLLATLGHQFDLTISSQPDLIRAVSSGIHDVAVFGAELDVPQDPAAGVVVTKASGVTSVKQLAGHTIGAPSLTGNNWSAFECWLGKQGVSLSSVRGVQALPPQIPDLLTAGRLDGTLIFNPILSSLEAKGDKYLGDPYQGCFGNGEQNGYFTGTTAWATANKLALAKLLAAEKEAVRFIASHRSVALKTYEQKSGLPVSVAKEAVIYPPEMNFKISTADFANWERILKHIGLFTGTPPPPSKLVLPLPSAS